MANPRKVPARRAARGEQIIDVDAQDARPTYVRIPSDQPAEYFDEPATAETVQDAALLGVLSELGARDEDSKVSVFRVVNDGGIKKDAFLYECHPSQFTMSDLQECYGAGDYRVKVFGKEADSNYKTIHANKRITIGPSKDQARIGALPPAQPAAPQPVPGIAAEIAHALAPVLSIMATAMQKMSERNAGGVDQNLAHLEQLARIAGLSRGNAPAPDPMQQFEAAMKLATLMRGASGDGVSTDDPGTALMLKGADVIKELFIAARGAGAALPSVAHNAALNAPAAPVASAMPAAPAAPANNSEDDDMNMMLRAQITMFLGAAKLNDDTTKWAGRIFEDAPDELLGALVAPDWFEKLCEIAPGFSSVKPWLEKVRAEVLEEMKVANMLGADGALLTAETGSGMVAPSANPAGAPVVAVQPDPAKSA